ncbi:hypothetical protein [Streptomyces chartreusis]|uniref:hypothetical protein n=1 Tax=Streptomyces chartreusis TaxID=1969 RepID=UPI0016745353|nr:hypothetical protein [Streptomyces chartreusis]GGX58148.1 hypothetical protein GCM10010321_88820 [Streptomyces chartreusis]
MKISERSSPARYRAALVGAALRSGVAHDALDGDFDQAATTAGLRPPALTESREAVRYALECPVDFMGDDSNQDIAQAVFDAACERRPLVVLDNGGRPVVMVPQPVEESA